MSRHNSFPDPGRPSILETPGSEKRRIVPSCVFFVPIMYWIPEPVSGSCECKVPLRVEGPHFTVCTMARSSMVNVFGFSWVAQWILGHWLSCLKSAKPRRWQHVGERVRTPPLYMCMIVLQGTFMKVEAKGKPGDKETILRRSVRYFVLT
jgi:hypothetical protein